MKSVEEIRRRLRIFDHERNLLAKKLPPPSSKAYSMAFAAYVGAFANVNCLRWVLGELSPQEEEEVNQSLRDHERMHGTGN